MQTNKTTRGKHSIFEGLNNHDTKPFWKYIKSKRNGQSPNNIIGHNLISDSKGKAEIILEQFKSVFTRTSDTTR